MATTFTPQDIDAFKPAEKIGLVATVSPEGLPHITLITSIMACSPTQLTLGEFSKGKSKEYLQQNPRLAFLILTMDRKIWRGRAVWTHLKKEGPEYEAYNNIPMFRYNAYFGINTVHYLDLIETSGRESLPLPGIILSALYTRWAKKKLSMNKPGQVLKPFAERAIFNNLASLKFISWVGPDGFPELVPVVQCQAADSGRLAFTCFPYGRELDAIPDGAPVAVFGLTMVMENVLIRGNFVRQKGALGLPMAVIDIDWVYNSMPPCHGQIYPEIPLTAVTSF
ncbi:MAG: hypothetical protein AB1724_19410 [Thermodesulfobacteriota bacterium]